MAVFSPGAIVIAYVIAEDLAQGEPGVAGALANAAVGDDRLAAVHPDCGVDLAQLVGGFEGAVGGDGRAPGHIDRTGNMAGADGQLLHAFRGKDAAVEFVRRADINQLRLLLAFSHRYHIDKACPQGLVTLAETDIAGGMGDLAGGQRAAFLFPLGATAIQQLDVLHTVHVEYPGTQAANQLLLSPYRMTVLSLDTPASRSSFWKSSAEAISRRTGSTRSVCQLTFTAPGICPRSY